MKFEDMIGSKSDAELGSMMRDRFRRLIEARDAGLTDTHPVEQWNADNKVLRAHRAAQDGGNDPGDQPSVGDPNAANDDDPPENATTTGVRGGPREGNRISEDSGTVAARLRTWGLSDRRIREIMTRSLVSDADRAAAAALVPGYYRLP